VERCHFADASGSDTIHVPPQCEDAPHFFADFFRHIHYAFDSLAANQVSAPRPARFATGIMWFDFGLAALLFGETLVNLLSLLRSRALKRIGRPRPVLELLESRDLLSISPFAPGGGDSAFLEPGASVAQIKNPSNPVNVTPVSNDFNVNTDAGEPVGRHNETSIAVNPNNPLNIVACTNDTEFAVTPSGQFQEAGISRVRYTTDGGKSWTTIALVSNDYNFTGDPSVSFDEQGTVYVGTLGFRYNGGNSLNSTNPDVIVAHSTDGGATWTKQIRVASGTGSFLSPGESMDKDYLTAWGNGNAIDTWTQFNQTKKGATVSQIIYASVTHDGGNTWSTPVVISGSLLVSTGATPVVAADGSIYVSFLNGDFDVASDGYRDQYMVVKIDPQTGQALSAPVKVGQVYDGIYDNPVNSIGDPTYQDSQFRSFSLGNITADPNDKNHLAVVWADMRDQGGFLTSSDPYSVKTNSDIIVVQSIDGGQTWSPAVPLQIPNDQFQPWAEFDKNSNLQIGYFDRSYDMANNHEYGYTLATVGQTMSSHWTFHTQELSTALSDPTTGDRWSAVTVNKDFPNATLFLGDYSNIAVTPTGVAAYWTDMRNDVTFLGKTGHGQDVYFALTSSLPAPSMADITLGNALVAFDQWFASQKKKP
jgi:hypothetical protein